MRTPPSDRGAAFVASLRRFRRRLRLSLFVRAAATTGVVAFGLLNLVLLTMPQARAAAIPAWAATLVLAVAAAWVIAVMRTPSLLVTATTLDRALQLHDRCVTALQFSGESDAASSLVVGDAVARLEGVAPARLPLGVSVSRYWLAAVLAASPVLIAPLPQPSVTTIPAGGGGAAAVRGPGVQRSDSRSQDKDRTAVSAASARDGGVRPADPESSTRPSMPAGTARDSRPDSARTDQSQAIASRPEQAESPGAAVGGRDGIRAGGTAVGGPNDPPPSAIAAARTGAGEAADSAARPGASLSAAGRGGRGRGASDAAAGGVADGAILPSTARMPAMDREGAAARGTAAYRAAYARAEAALAKEPVPPRLRSYVRGYFLAIRPEAVP